MKIIINQSITDGEKPSEEVSLNELRELHGDDPMIEKTSWRPVDSTGSNFYTHQIVKQSDYRLEFGPSREVKNMPIVALIFCAICAYLPQWIAGDNPETSNFEIFAPYAMAGLIFIVVIRMYMRLTIPIIFDRDSALYWRGPKRPRGTPPGAVDLAEIYAIQVLDESVRGNKSQFITYELNLILQSGERVLVLNHNNEPKIREQAQAVGEFLDVPVWIYIKEPRILGYVEIESSGS